MSYGRGYNRDVSRRKALRKRRIDRETQGHYSFTPYYDNLHQYSKNKVHCSCHMCSSKTNNKGKRRTMYGNYDPSYNPSAADRRANDRMNYQEQEVMGVLIYYWYDHMLRETMPEVVAAIGKAIENHDWNSFKFFYDHQLALGVELPDIIYDCDNNRHWILNEQNFKRIQENEYECG